MMKSDDKNDWRIVLWLRTAIVICLFPSLCILLADSVLLSPAKGFALPYEGPVLAVVICSWFFNIPTAESYKSWIGWTFLKIVFFVTLVLARNEGVIFPGLIDKVPQSFDDSNGVGLSL